MLGTLIASRRADALGPQRVVATTFGLAAIALVLFTFGFPLPLLLTLVAVAGTGTIGTQVLIYGFVSNFYSTSARAAGVAWCAPTVRPPRSFAKSKLTTPRQRSDRS